MTWNDKPYYEQYRRFNKETKTSTPIPTLLYRSAESPSSTLIWHMQEDKKRMQGLENEIDIAQIKAALAGVKNKWFNKIKQNPEAFVQKEGKFNWEVIKKIL